jgi:biotin synthase-like enzyme
MAQKAQRLTRQRFGNTVSFYVPLYLSNLCANDCTYCGFSMSNRIKRKTLNGEEIARECEAIRAWASITAAGHRRASDQSRHGLFPPALSRHSSALQFTDDGGATDGRA